MSVVTISSSAAQRPIFAGVDVGGTSIKIGLVDDRGRTIGATKIVTRADDAVSVAIAEVNQALRSLCEEHRVSYDEVMAVGLGTPGTMDIPGGMILEPPNLPGWRHFPIRDALATACERPVTFANDAGAAAYGEFWVGAGHAFELVCVFTLGTGVGGGVILGDVSLDGAHSHGAEFGHIVIDTTPTARMCSCGKPGHLEAYASATGLVGQAVERLAEHPTSALAAFAPEALTAYEVAQAAERGDTLALELVDEVASRLAMGVLAVTHVIDPQAVILGGAMNFGGNDAELGRRFIEGVRSRFRELTFPVQAEQTVIEFASLGGSAGYIGAAGLARLAMSKRSEGN
ncbi:MAG: ROK family protein [Planctomycetales bacterium]|nr:ROK family protein [Planctomycetales bacterium]